MKWVILFTTLFPFWAYSGSIYLCKAYSGGTFWAKSTCSQHSALIDSIVSVPDNLPFDQQVNLAEQQRRLTTNTNTVTNNPSVSVAIGECSNLTAQIIRFDAMARQPQSGQMQDWITAEKKKVRDRQFTLRC